MSPFWCPFWPRLALRRQGAALKAWAQLINANDRIADVRLCVLHVKRWSSAAYELLALLSSENRTTKLLLRIGSELWPFLAFSWPEDPHGAAGLQSCWHMSRGSWPVCSDCRSVRVDVLDLTLGIIICQHVLCPLQVLLAYSCGVKATVLSTERTGQGMSARNGAYWVD